VSTLRSLLARLWAFVVALWSKPTPTPAPAAQLLVAPFAGDWLYCTADEVHTLTWEVQRPTLIRDFDINAGSLGGMLQSLRVRCEEQLMQPMPVEALFDSAALGRELSLPTLRPGDQLTLTLSNFSGRIRPVGVEIL
jgi:hypothetical protein